VADIPENRAKVVSLSGERVAIFRFDGRIAALSNVCQHQNGPLGEGRILDGCVTCPWHGYQYRPEDGASPPPFTERVPTFRVKVVAGRILVDPRPLPPGTRVEPAVFDPATPAPTDRHEFFVGYLSMPAPLRGFHRRVSATLAIVAVLVAVVAGASQRPLGRGEFEYGIESRLEGVLRAAPIPLLWTPLGSDATGGFGEPRQRYRVVPLVGQGKHGVAPAVLALAGRPVALTGSWIRRDGSELFEVERAETIDTGAAGAGSAPEPATASLGRRRLRGEVVDSKCYLGVMKPGDGKSHRDCAVRCISGGSPAALVARTAKGEAWVLLLVTPDGRPLGRELLDLVAEPVEVEGEVLRLGGLPLLVTGLPAIRRSGQDPAR
jgi:nitrite reductase/ring-hydroxylating ferredoxin subunit